MFASMYAAYEALSDRMKAYLDGMVALHDGVPVPKVPSVQRRSWAASMLEVDRCRTSTGVLPGVPGGIAILLQVDSLG